MKAWRCWRNIIVSFFLETSRLMSGVFMIFHLNLFIDLSPRTKYEDDFPPSSGESFMSFQFNSEKTFSLSSVEIAFYSSLAQLGLSCLSLWLIRICERKILFVISGTLMAISALILSEYIQPLSNYLHYDFGQNIPEWFSDKMVF